VTLSFAAQDVNCGESAVSKMDVCLHKRLLRNARNSHPEREDFLFSIERKRVSCHEEMGCYKLTYEYEKPLLFLEREPKKIDTPDWQVWSNPNTTFLRVDARDGSGSGNLVLSIRHFSEQPLLQDLPLISLRSKSSMAQSMLLKLEQRQSRYSVMVL
jgi:hypothetical protein